MKYFIGFLLPDEASEWHIETTKEISLKFNTWKIYEKIPPHITIYYPEGVEDITNIRSYIKEWAHKNNAQGNFYISGFDHFEDRVVFAKVEADEFVTQSIENLRAGIRDINPIKNELFPNWHPHSTLANEVSSEDINKIWEYTNKLKKPNFTVPFDNITIFKYEGNQKWMVDEIFKLS